MDLSSNNMKIFKEIFEFLRKDSYGLINKVFKNYSFYLKSDLSNHEENIKISKNLNAIQTEQQIIRPNPPSPNQSPRKFNTSKLRIDTKKTEVEQTIKRPNTIQIPQTIEKQTKFNTVNQTPRKINTTNNAEQGVKKPNTAQTTKKIKMPNNLPANKTPRKLNTSNKTARKKTSGKHTIWNISMKFNKFCSRFFSSSS